MVGVNIIAFGKLKEKYLTDACAEYLKRLGAFCKPCVVELADVRLSDNPSETEISLALKKEAKLLENYLNEKNSFNIAMCIEGGQLPSIEFSKKLATAKNAGSSKINFIIGSSYGLDDSVKKAADMRLSMSAMTYPHQLARVMLLEQIYRAFMIENNV